jgi:hypothetical protein
MNSSVQRSRRQPERRTPGHLSQCHVLSRQPTCCTCDPRSRDGVPGCVAARGHAQLARFDAVYRTAKDQGPRSTCDPGMQIRAGRRRPMLRQPGDQAVPRPIAVANRVRSFICIFMVPIAAGEYMGASPQLAVLIGQASNEAALVRRCLARSCRSVGAKRPDSCPPHAEIAA